MKKKVTIHDIAREAGVSAATVSYVINNRTDQSISEETKQKVWHIVNLFNYEPNVFAKNLRSAPPSKFIAVYGSDGSPLLQSEYINILNSLKEYFEPLKYGILFASRPFTKIDYADAIVAFNISAAQFHEIGKLNFIPLVAADCLVNDPVFFQVTYDYAKLKSQAEEYFGDGYTFVTITPADLKLREEIESIFPDVIFADSFYALDKINADRTIATCDRAIYDYCKNRGLNVHFFEQTYKDKSRTIAICLQKALSHEPYDEHFFKI